MSSLLIFSYQTFFDILWCHHNHFHAERKLLVRCQLVERWPLAIFKLCLECWIHCWINTAVQSPRQLKKKQPKPLVSNTSTSMFQSKCEVLLLTSCLWSALSISSLTVGKQFSSSCLPWTHYSLRLCLYLSVQLQTTAFFLLYLTQVSTSFLFYRHALQQE